MTSLSTKLNLPIVVITIFLLAMLIAVNLHQSGELRSEDIENELHYVADALTIAVSLDASTGHLHEAIKMVAEREQIERLAIIDPHQRNVIVDSKSNSAKQTPEQKG